MQLAQAELFITTHVVFLIRWTQLHGLLLFRLHRCKLPYHEAQQQMYQIQEKIDALTKSSKPLCNTQRCSLQSS